MLLHIATLHGHCRISFIASFLVGTWVVDFCLMRMMTIWSSGEVQHIEIGTVWILNVL